MSHRYIADDGTIFLHNPDMSGDVEVVIDHEGSPLTVRLSIPGETLLEFMTRRDHDGTMMRCVHGYPGPRPCPECAKPPEEGTIRRTVVDVDGDDFTGGWYDRGYRAGYKHSPGTADYPAEAVRVAHARGVTDERRRCARLVADKMLEPIGHLLTDAHVVEIRNAWLAYLENPDA